VGLNTQNQNEGLGFDPDSPQLKNRVVILNGFEDSEILEIMRQVKGLCRTGAEGETPAIAASRGDLIFARTTAASLQTRLGSLIIDLSEDHDYLKKNPPQARGIPV
jgi:hypothetical protein